MDSQDPEDVRGSLFAILDDMESDLRAAGFIGTNKVLRILKKIRLTLEEEVKTR